MPQQLPQELRHNARTDMPGEAAGERQPQQTCEGPAARPRAPCSRTTDTPSPRICVPPAVRPAPLARTVAVAAAERQPRCLQRLLPWLASLTGCACGAPCPPCARRGAHCQRRPLPVYRLPMTKQLPRGRALRRHANWSGCCCWRARRLASSCGGGNNQSAQTQGTLAYVSGVRSMWVRGGRGQQPCSAAKLADGGCSGYGWEMAAVLQHNTVPRPACSASGQGRLPCAHED